MEFKVNGVKQDYSMKLGEGGEAFFVFETTDEIPASLRTSPLVSPTDSPRQRSEENLPALPDPDYLDLAKSSSSDCVNDLKPGAPMLSNHVPAAGDLGTVKFLIATLPMYSCCIQGRSPLYRSLLKNRT